MSSLHGWMTLELMPNQGIGGGASIAGRLQIDAANGFQPASGDRFQVITCSTSCQGSFSTASGNLTPAFGGFAGNGEVVIAEPQAAALIGIRPENAVMHRNETNAYLLKIINPTAQQLNIGSLMITLPISFTY